MLESPHVEPIIPYVRNILGVLKKDQALKHSWMREKSKNFQDFIRNFVTGLTLYAGALAITPYVNCGEHRWRWIPVIGFGLAAIAMCMSATLSWSLTFRWRTAQLFTRRVVIFALVVCSFFSVDISLWGNWKVAADNLHCNGNATIFSWIGSRF